MGRIPTLGATLFIGIFLSGCATYTYTQYESEMRYSQANELREVLIKDDSMAVCFNMKPSQLVHKARTAILECVREEKPKRPYELSLRQVVTYATADGECGQRKFVIEHMDSIDLNAVPAKYLTTCKTWKEYYAEE